MGGDGSDGVDPADRGAPGWRVDLDEPRVLGLPLRWFGAPERVERQAVRHPLAYLRWRRERRLLGPYARSLAQVVADRPEPDA